MILWLPGTPEPGNSQPCFLGSYVVWHHAELCLWIMTLHPGSDSVAGRPSCRFSRGGDRGPP